MTALADLPVAQAGPRTYREPGSSGPGPAAVRGAVPAPVRDQVKTMRSWPLLVFAVPAAAEVWSGWVGIAQKTGFTGRSSPRPACGQGSGPKPPPRSVKPIGTPQERPRHVWSSGWGSFAGRSTPGEPPCRAVTQERASLWCSGAGQRDGHRDRGRPEDSTRAPPNGRLVEADRGRVGLTDNASVNPEAAAHAITITINVPAASLDWIVLATDGAIETARHLGLDDWDAMADSGHAALAGFLQRCHDWEENDPDARQLPRAKRHDDKATATIRLA
jgi:hypothetical protein